MEVKKAITERRSIRGFTDRPVSQEILREVLRLATQAVSAVNAQPWQFLVVTGDVLKSICEDNMDCVRNNLPQDRPFGDLSGIYHTRRVDVAKKLLTAMEIPREDKARRAWWGERGYRFFDAPAAIILCMDEELDECTYRFDMGCVTQNLCLAAWELGLGTCVEYQGVIYERGLRKYLGVPENKRFVCSIAIGYPDPEFPANAVRVGREDVDSVTSWYGFPEQD